MARPPKIPPKRVIKLKIPKLTPKQTRLLLLKEEAKKKRQELAELRKQLEPTRRKARKQEAAARKLEQLISGEVTNVSKDSTIVTDEELESLPAQVKDDILEEDVNILFKPNPGPQTEFLAATEKEVLFGGARGGGKSFSLIVDPLRYCDKANHRALLIRKTMPELRDMISQAHRLYKAAFPEVKWKEQEKVFTFPSGARIEFGYAENEQDAMRYQGQAYTWIGIDEIGLYATDRILTLLKGSLRSVDTSIPTFIRMSCVDQGEVLTEGGWKDIKEIKVGELVYSLNILNELELQPVIKTIKQYVEEDLVQINKKGFFASITKDHSLILQKKSSWCKKKFTDLNVVERVVRAPSRFYGKVNYTPPLGLELQDYLILLGLFLSEGCTTTRNRVTITQVKQYGHDQLLEFLVGLNSKFRYYKGGDFSLTDKVWHAYFLQFGKAKDKFIPRDVLNLSDTSLEYLFESLMFGDGSWQNEDCGTYYTTSKQLAYDFAELSLKLGYRVSISELFRNSYIKNPKLQYLVYINKRKFTHLNLNEDKDKITYIPYKGFVYCLEIESNHNFVIKQKGSIRIDGNCNPGGPGMSWLKEQFVDAAPWNETFYVPIEQPDGTVQHLTRRFIPSKLSDNPYLNQTPEYRNMLLSLPDKLKKMWLEGRWDIIEGAAFEEFDPAIHVVDSFDIPSNWPRFRTCDWGFSTNFCVLWLACDYENTLWVYREFYGKGLTADIFAQRVRQLELGEYVQYGVMDSSVWSRRGDVGPPVPEIMRLNGCVWRPSDRSPGSRHSGKAELHRRLRIFDGPDGKPTAKLKIFKSCRNLIRTLPALPLDKNDLEDIDTTAEDHPYDALRYGIMSRPIDPVRLDFYQQINRQEQWKPANMKVGY